MFPLGDYDWTLGGHLILEELGLIFELAPGDNIIFPSAAFTHYNLPIQKGEERHSVVAYSAGLLFRHQVLKRAPFSGLSKKEQKKLLAKQLQERVAEGWSRFSTLAALRGHYKRAPVSQE